MRPPHVDLVDNDESGYWKITVTPSRGGERGRPIDITMVRGVPTRVESMTTSDPFGPAEATLVVPGVSALDTFGEGSGDLEWLMPEADVTISWQPIAEGLQRLEWMKRIRPWYGYILRPSWTYTEASGALTLQLRGAMHQLDNYLAMPEYLGRPITFEHAVARQFRKHPGMRVGQMRMTWPHWWDKTYIPDSSAPWYMRPEGVRSGQKWTGMLTRETGQREPALTSYVQGLLSAMWSERGQWTLMLDYGRVPHMFHREHLLSPSTADVYLDLLTPGLDLSVSVDYMQRANVIYGQGRSLAGVTYSGMQVTPSGSTPTRETMYRPFAALKATHPEDPDSNPWFDPSMMRKEINLDFFEGLTAAEAEVVARDHLRRFADPGVIAEVALNHADPRDVTTNQVVPRQTLQAGMNVRLDGLFGHRPGPVMHITEAQVTPESVSMTLDSRFRDQLTVEEIKLRGRDALNVPRMLTVGAYNPHIPDQLLPWDYSLGSGAIPLGSKDYFAAAPADLQFPWTDWVREHPPSKSQYRSSFIKIGPADNRDASKNWNRRSISQGDGSIAPLLLSQAGTVRLLQIAAFWEDGTPAQVAFHVGIYANYAVSAEMMPKLTKPDGAPASWRYDGGRNRRYKAGQAYPFFPGAFERYNNDGSLFSDTTQVPSDGVEMVRAYGNYYAKAGYWPGGYTPDAAPSGMLVDETGMTYDGTRTQAFDPTGQGDNSYAESGRFGVLIYCDDQGSDPVYFIGRAWRTEYGTS